MNFGAKQIEIQDGAQQPQQNFQASEHTLRPNCSTETFAHAISTYNRALI